MENNSVDHRQLQGIIPDIVIKANSILASDDKLPGNPLLNRQSIIDVKTLAPGQTYSEHPNLNNNIAAVTRRQAKVNTDYHKSAQTLDQKYNGTLPNTIGPVETELNRFGIDGRVLGCVIGAFGECSKDIYHLRDLIAHNHAIALTTKLTISYNCAFGIYTNKLNRLWGLLIARGWARVLLGRRSLIQRGGSNGSGVPHESPSIFGFFNPDADIYESRMLQQNSNI